MNEYGRLRCVALCAPSTTFTQHTLHHEAARSEVVAREIKALGHLLTDFGVEVKWFDEAFLGERTSFHSNDEFFCRDQILRLPQRKLALCPMGVHERKGEYDQLLQWHGTRELGIDITLFSRQDQCEGADLLWARADVAILGVGKRTSSATAQKIEQIFKGEKIDLYIIPIDHHVCQHLLGILQFIGPGRALVRTEHAPTELIKLLDTLHIEVIAVPESAAVRSQQGMNVVLIDEANLIMTAQARELAPFYESLGFKTHLIDFAETIKCWGGPACASAILARD